MKSLCVAAAMLVATAGLAAAEPTTFVVTSSNNPAGNQLLVYDTAGNLIQAAPTGGLGGVAGNAGGIAATRDSIAVVNFQSQSVSIFDVTDAGVQFRQSHRDVVVAGERRVRQGSSLRPRHDDGRIASSRRA